MIKYKELVSSRITKTTYSPLDTLINNWKQQNPNITIHKTHYQLTGSEQGMFSSALIEYEEK